MLRLRLWLGWLGVPLMLAASCSSDDAQKTSPAPVSGSGGDLAGAASDDGGSATQGGTTTATGGTEAGGQGSGGEGTSALTDGWSSGTRLRAVLDVAGDAKRFRLWHDAELDVDCSFTPAADGVERCMPIVEHGYAVYSDAKCTKAVGVFGIDDPIPPYLAEPYRARECATGASFLEVGAAVTGVTDVFSNSSGSCSPNGTVSATQVVKQLGPAAAPAKFVAQAKITREPRDLRLEANVRVAEDGSREVIGFFDLERKTDCKPISRNPEYACVPDNLAFIEVFFADDKCKMQAAYYPGCDGTPNIILDSAPSNTGQYFEVGDLLTTPPLFRKDSTVCQPYTDTTEPNAKYYAPGKEVPWSDFAELTATDEGSGRIAVTALRGASDELLARIDFFDTELSTHCGVAEAADGKTRCLPSSIGSVNVFSDAACTSALFENQAGSPLPDGLAFLTANAPGGGTAVFKLGPKLATPAKTWQLGGLDCQERSVSAGADYYSSTPIPPSGLALVTREVE